MQIFDGKKESQKVLEKLKIEIEKRNEKPHLAVFLIGEDKASEIYVNLKRKASEKVGIEFSLYKYKSDIDEKEIIEKIKKLGADDFVNGIIVQLPLPEKFNTDKIISAINPKKDVDGFHKKNIELLESGKKGITPVMPKVILDIVKSSQSEICPSEIKALVNSEIFGKSLKNVFAMDGLSLKYLSCKNLKKEEIKDFSSDADVLISALGRAKFITEDMIKDKAVLIDAGISKKDGKILGDVDVDSLKKKAGFLTPVPGGVGPMVVAYLLKNVFYALIKRTLK